MIDVESWAAKNRLARWRTLTQVSPGEWVDGQGDAYDQYSRAELAASVADDRMTDNPADDDEDMTDDWFVAMGGQWVQRGSRDRLILGPFEWVEYPAYACALIDGPNKAVEITKKGPFRKACQAFGIPLKETK